MKETKKRSLTKSITWRIVATLLTLVIIYLFTGDALMSSLITAVGAILSFILYYIHERIWSIIKWGYV